MAKVTFSKRDPLPSTLSRIRDRVSGDTQTTIDILRIHLDDMFEGLCRMDPTKNQRSQVVRVCVDGVTQVQEWPDSAGLLAPFVGAITVELKNLGLCRFPRDAMTTFHNVTTMDLTGNDLDQLPLGFSKAFPNLKTLNLSNCRFRDSDAIFDGLCGHDNQELSYGHGGLMDELEELTIRNNELAHTFRVPSCMAKLRVLSISGNPYLRSIGYSWTDYEDQFPSLRVLDISACSWTNIVDALSRFKDCKLHTLTLDGLGIRNSDLVIKPKTTNVGALLRRFAPTLESLSMQSNSIDFNLIVSELDGFEKLVQLDLRDTYSSPNDLSKIQQLPPKFMDPTKNATIRFTGSDALESFTWWRQPVPSDRRGPNVKVMFRPSDLATKIVDYPGRRCDDGDGDGNDSSGLVYLGSYSSASNRPYMSKCRFTRVLSIGAENPPRHLDYPIKYHVVRIDDSTNWDILKYLHECVAFIDGTLTEDIDGKILVHCRQGSSRSVIVVCAYLMAAFGLTPSQAMERIHTLRPQQTHVNEKFLVQLDAWHRKRSSFVNRLGRWLDKVKK